MSDRYFVREASAARSPLVVSIPHCGVEVPASVQERLTESARELPDTDWHLEKLYGDWVAALGATTVYARYSRYLVDLNRPRVPEALYPGRFETSVVPTRNFDDEALYHEGAEPGPEEVEARLEEYWQPYHDRVTFELEARRSEFGYALLFDAHSIRSEVPALHAGRLPALMLGDVDGTSADPAISRAVLAVHEESSYSAQANRPFKGGFITRHFGRPATGLHALQLEMSQRLYMGEGAPYAYDADLAARLQPTLEETLRAFLRAAEGVANAT